VQAFSGFKLQKDQEYSGLGVRGATLQGITGKVREIIKITVEKITE